jgi:hypothetical protein
MRDKFALVVNGEVIATSAVPPRSRHGCGRWLRIEDRDSAPFDPTKHARLKPLLHIEGDVVIRTFPISMKEKLLNE